MLMASVAAAQTAITVKSDSGCVTTGSGRVECRKIVGGDNWVRFDHASMDSAMMKRPVLGLELRPTGTKRDTLGVFVESVIPKGPAENAGIFEGDRISAINGVDLRVASADIDDPYTNGIAAHKLTREVQKLTPGSRVTLRVYSAGRFRDVPVTVGRASDFPHSGGFNIQIGGPGMMQLNGSGMRMSPMEMGIDPEHLRMMIEQGMQHGEGNLMPVRTPDGAPMKMPLVRMKAPVPPVPLRPTRLIRI
jgi:hypothetical protein